MRIKSLVDTLSAILLVSITGAVMAIPRIPEPKVYSLSDNPPTINERAGGVPVGGMLYVRLLAPGEPNALPGYACSAAVQYQGVQDFTGILGGVSCSDIFKTILPTSGYFMWDVSCGSAQPNGPNSINVSYNNAAPGFGFMAILLDLPTPGCPVAIVLYGAP